MRIVVIVPTDNHYHTRQRKFLLWNVFKNNNAFYRHSVASNFTVTRAQSAINFVNVCKPSLQLLQRMFLIPCIVQAINDIDNGLNFFKRTCPTLWDLRLHILRILSSSKIKKHIIFVARKVFNCYCKKINRIFMVTYL